MKEFPKERAFARSRKSARAMIVWVMMGLIAAGCGHRHNTNGANCGDIEHLGRHLEKPCVR